MCVNASLTRAALTTMTAGSVIALALSVYYGRIAWRSSPAEWIAYLQSKRPRSWRTWPVYGWLWSRADAKPRSTLWQARILCVFMGAVFGVLGLVNVGSIVFHQQLGIPACGDPMHPQRAVTSVLERASRVGAVQPRVAADGACAPPLNA